MTEEAKKDRYLNTVIGKCLLLKLIGKGGMGNVYLGHHQFLQKKVAVKLLPPDFTRNQEFLDRFHREAIAAAKIEHPNIAQVHDVGSENDCYYIVMTYVEGQTLQDTLDGLKEPMDPRESARIALEVARGLKAAHDERIVHRDIKPANILVSTKGEVKITDFGLAFDVEGETQLTRAGAIMGTPHFLSPEQADGKRADARSDLYSLGVVLYYMAAGKKPFVGESTMAILYKHLHQPVEPPQKVNPKLPPPLGEIILKLLQKSPEKRHPKADDLIRDLEHFLAAPESASKRSGSSASLHSVGAHPRKSSILRPVDPNLHTPPLRKSRPLSDLNLRRRSRLIPILIVSAVVCIVGGIALAVLLNTPPKEDRKNSDSTHQPPPKDAVAELWKKAKEAEEAGRFPEALRLYKEILAKKDTPEIRSSIERVEARLRELVEEEDWKTASGANTEKSYEAFLQKHPNGKRAEEAKKALAALRPPWTLEPDFERVYLEPKDGAQIFVCDHLRPYMELGPDSMTLSYPNEAPGPENEFHGIWHKRLDSVDFIFRGEIYLERGRPILVGHFPSSQLHEPGRAEYVRFSLEGSPSMLWVPFEFQIVGEQVTLSIQGQEPLRQGLYPNQSTFGHVGFRLHKGDKLRVRRLRLKVLKQANLDEIREKMRRSREEEAARRELQRVQTLANESRPQLLQRRPGPLRAKIDALRGELKSERVLQELESLHARVEACERVLAGFFDHCRANRERELEIPTRSAVRKGVVRSVGERFVLLGGTQIPLEEVLPGTVADFAQASNGASRLQQGLFLLVEGAGGPAMERMIVGTGLLAGAEPYLDELVDTVVTETLRFAERKQTREAEALLQRLAALERLLTAAHLKRIDDVRAELSKDKFERMRQDAGVLLQRKKLKEGRDLLLAILKDPLSGKVAPTAAKDLYASILFDETWTSGLARTDLADWNLDEAARRDAKVQTGEIQLETTVAFLGPKELRNARGISVEVQVNQFRGVGGVGLYWAWKDKDNLRKMEMQANQVLVALVEGGKEKLAGQLPLTSSPTGKWMRLAMFEYGDCLLVFFNGELVHRGDPAKGDPFRGASGLFVSNANAKIRKVELWSLAK